MLARLFLAALPVSVPLAAMAQVEPIGIVIMHGKGGSPTRFVSGLASALEGKDYLVANLEMPWSGRLSFSLPVSRAEENIDVAVAGLRAKGAKKVFIAGHSLGGVYALHLAGSQAVDGFIAIAPGGNIGNPGFRQNLNGAITRARQLVAEGKGNERAQLQDYEGGRGTYLIDTVPANYLAWHDLEGPFNMDRAAKAANPQLPILWIAPTRDYPALLRTGIPVFRTLPPNPLTRLYEPNADHFGAPAASVDEIVRWTREVATAPKR